MLRIGVIGCGKIAQVRHLPEYAENPDVQIAALADLNLERTKELAQRYGAKAYASDKELLADPSIDAVSICSANNSHAEMAIAALKAGKHVLCEKPMATTLEDCEAMVKAAEQARKASDDRPEPASGPCSSEGARMDSRRENRQAADVSHPFRSWRPGNMER